MLRRRAASTLALLALGVTLVVGCAERDGRDEPRGSELLVQELPNPVERDWAEVVPTDTLVALLVNNSTSYFIYRGEAMGFEFRALRRFASDHDMVLRVVPVRDRTELFRRLNRGQGDVAAGRLRASPHYEGHVLTAGPVYSTPSAVVQRIGAPEETVFPDPIDSLFDRGDFASVSADLDSLFGSGPRRPLSLAKVVDRDDLTLRPIRHRSELGGKRIFLPRGSALVNQLVEIYNRDDEIVDIVEVRAARTAEALIRQVARGAIRFTVAPSNVAGLKEDYFDNIEAFPTAGPRTGTVWATRTTSPELHGHLERWLEAHRGEGDYLDELYFRYFVDRAAYNERVTSRYLTSETGRLSEHDALLFDKAEALGWDWRLLASQAFQESRFDAEAVSWAGARGMLQLMPATARDVGVSDPFDPEENVSGAVRYIEWLEERWNDWVADDEERLRFVLASYNAGTGHVEDARRMARKHGDDPDRWEDVAFWLLQLSKPSYYRDPVVRFGFVRGLEPVTYVSLILERYAHYRRFVAEVPRAVEAAGDRVGD